MFNEGMFELLPYLIWNGWFGCITDEGESCGYSLNTPELSDDLRKQISLHRLQFSLTKLKKSALDSGVLPSEVGDPGYECVVVSGKLDFSRKPRQLRINKTEQRIPCFGRIQSGYGVDPSVSELFRARFV
jgi:hypothetical protein